MSGEGLSRWNSRVVLYDMVTGAGEEALEDKRIEMERFMRSGLGMDVLRREAEEMMGAQAVAALEKKTFEYLRKQDPDEKEELVRAKARARAIAQSFHDGAEARLGSAALAQAEGKALEALGTTVNSLSDDTKQSVKELAALAAVTIRRFRIGGACLGAWLGLVLGLKLLGLSVRRRQTTYEPDASLCVGCGRCYEHCPQEHARRGLVGQAVNTEAKAAEKGEVRTP
jgi:ferredoxin